jgi:hypothetical protein
MMMIDDEPSPQQKVDEEGVVGPASAASEAASAASKEIAHHSEEDAADEFSVHPQTLASLLSTRCFRTSNSPNHPLANSCDDNWTWNTKDKSHEVRLYGPKHRIAHFHPNWSNGTAGVRGTRVLNNGRFYWELNVSQRIFGTRYKIHAAAIRILKCPSV